MLLQDLRTSLVKDQTVTSICGSRVYPILIPEGALMPAIVLQPLKSDAFNALDGWSGLDLGTIILDCLGLQYADVTRLRDAVRANLQALGLIMQEQTEDYDPPVRLYRISQQWLVWN